MLSNVDMRRLPPNADHLKTTTAGWTCKTIAGFRNGVLALPNLTNKVRAGVEQYFAVLEARIGLLDQSTADAKVIRDFVDEMNNHRCGGLEHRVWRRVRQLVTAGLRACELERMPRRHEVKLMPEWQRLIALVTKASERNALRRFASWCSMHGLGPADVTPADFGKFVNDAQETVVRKPGECKKRDYFREIFLQLCNAWNRAVVALPQEWPQLAVPCDLHRLWRTRPLTAYATSLQDEIRNMLRTRAECDGDVLSPWRAPLTGAKSEDHVVHLLRYVLHELCDELKLSPEVLISLKQVITPVNIDLALTRGVKRKGERKDHYHYGVAVEMRNIARNWLMLPEADLKQLDKIVKAHNPRTIGRSEKSRNVLLEFTDELFIKAVRTLGERTVQKYDAVAGKDYSAAAWEVQGVLAVELGIKLALTLTALASLQFGRDIEHDGARWRYSCAMGNGADNFAYVDLPASASLLLNLYLKISGIEPTVGTWLFSGADPARHKHVSVLSRQIGTTLHSCGKRITGGYLQDLAVYLRLLNDPTDIGGAADMVGHLSEVHIKHAFKFLFDLDVIAEFDEGLRKAGRGDAKHIGVAA